MAQMLDKRARTNIVDLYNKGSTGCAISKRLCLCESTVYKIINLYNETGSIQPRPGRKGPKLQISDSDLQYVKALTDLWEGCTIQGIIELLELNVSDACLRNSLKSRLHYTYKKNISPNQAAQQRSCRRAGAMAKPAAKPENR
jgi:transposase